MARDNLTWGQQLITNELWLKLGLTTSGITTVAHDPMHGIGQTYIGGNFDMRPFHRYERFCRSQNPEKKFGQTTTFLNHHSYIVLSYLLSPHKITLVFSYLDCILTAIYGIRSWLSKVPIVKQQL